jgi:peptide subunit release factor 1 (eRF1)
MKRLVLIMLLAVTVKSNATMNESLSPPPSPMQECKAEADMLFELATMRDKGESKDDIRRTVLTEYTDTTTGTLAPEQKHMLMMMVDFVFEPTSIAFSAYQLRESQQQACLQQETSNK